MISGRRYPVTLHGTRAAAIWISWVLLLVWAFHVGGCGATREDQSKTSNSDMPQRDINRVLRDHDDELMAIPGVVGVFVGLLQDGKTPCIKVMAAQKTPELQRKIPRSLEGHPIVLEETGAIRPLQN